MALRLIGLLFTLLQLNCFSLAVDQALICSRGCTQPVTYWQQNLASWSDQHQQQLCQKTWLNWMTQNDTVDNSVEIIQLWISWQLNRAHGACSPPELKFKVVELTKVLLTCSFLSATRQRRSTLIDIYYILVDYDQGLIGPGHCQCNNTCPQAWKYWAFNLPADSTNRTYCNQTWADWLNPNLIELNNNKLRPLVREYLASQLNIATGSCPTKLINDTLSGLSNLEPDCFYHSYRHNSFHLLLTILTDFNYQCQLNSR